jgi:hypothetical protein
VLGPALSLLYINDRPKLICDLSKPILFADDTSTIILYKDATNFKIKTNKLFEIINKWLGTNMLIINYGKTCFLQFQTKKLQNAVHTCQLFKQPNFKQF